MKVQFLTKGPLLNSFRPGIVSALLLAHIPTTGAQSTLLDATFDPGSGANGFISAAASQPDGRIIVAGAFTEFNGISHNHIARLNPDGSLDPSFDPGEGANDLINALAIQPDGAIVIGGFFTQFNGVGRSGIARLNTNGSIDTGFDPGEGVEQLFVYPQVHTIALKGDGKIVIGGFFKNVNGAARDGVAQLNSDGSVDAAFVPGSGLQGYVALAVIALPNEQVLLGGIFENVNGLPRKSHARLTVDRSVDASFFAPKNA